MKTIKTHPLHEVIEEGIRDGIAAALKRHRLLGEKVAVWKDGRVQVLSVDELDLDENGYPRHANGANNGSPATDNC
ncbi:MAG: hypothetical protein JO295_13105 [Verrucomicrobia bacterium]|nr:hypothetical protein [Verrucomicrobiota bacterium]